ncbi:hypothetical protein SPRG_11000 [Saprolegnia parasitica CBS 223.65]|uniref:CSC1/OSCA1-like 7TM region domain-containing protein n=1 Tax=Saprolegnia parasitica (strain CBS 223.65) TaxID=695850 RepID=A0A067C850_SAPPC|nr:hypothetical protein SPRG_11000 [Saprolegnia parasitica CBS 223.65]KDO22686.1 hypothetical protein SPRG_11000 [Saprolegnia parasitica CBS 223.65]|eukprot:XP_012206601.1 hypothetical protein SPRG_11000 [Saprolegnia parasitica CBS 223.65]
MALHRTWALLPTLLAALVALAAADVVTLHVPTNATNDLLVALSLSANDTRAMPTIAPSPLVLRTGATSVNFTITGAIPGRYPLSYKLVSLVSGNTTYELSAETLVVFIVNDQWQSTLSQFGINVALVLGGVGLFLWRRGAKRDLWFWGAPIEGVFEPDPFRSDETMPSLLAAPTWQERGRRFWMLGCDDAYIVDACGVDAALFLRFNLDAAKLFSALTILSCALLLPINFVSGDGPTTSSQQATIANVPVQSPYFWGHVVMCYLTAGAVLFFVFRQNRRLEYLHLNDTTLIGPRSVFVQAGLPLDVTRHELRQWFLADYPEDIDQVYVVADLSRVYTVLEQRMRWRNDLQRLETVYMSPSSLPLSPWLRYCPGGACCPSPADIWFDYLARRPCQSHAHVASRPLREPLLSENMSTPKDAVTDDDETEMVPPRIVAKVAALRAQLAAVPEDILSNYARRTGTGAAFVVFNSNRARDQFLDRFRQTQAPLSQCVASTAATLCRRRPRRATVDSSGPSRLARHLSDLVVHPAPEPHDLKWAKMTYRPHSLRRFCQFGLYHALTIVLLLLFSTPASVLLYFNLQPGSDVYGRVLTSDSLITGFLHTYLPTLFLVCVNWVLLTVLFYVSFLEPWFTESRRMRSFLSKGFAYLFLFDFVPSIGVTAVYAATKTSSQVAFGGASSREVKYVNDFLYKLCSNFFVGYILQLTCLGSLTQLLRIGEKLFYQPWVISRAVTTDEVQAAREPWPFYFGYDYAVLLSVFTIGLLGSVLSPYLVPCAAVFFFAKYYVSKYNFVYVHPKTPGRGNVARAAYSLALVCLLLFELAMTSILSQLGNANQWLALVLLTCATLGVFVYWRVVVYRALETETSPTPVEVEAPTTQLRRQQSMELSRAVFQAHSLGEMEALVHARPTQAYINPYDVGLQMLSVLHRYQALRTAKLRDAFNLLKQQQHEVCSPSTAAASDPSENVD